MINEKILDQKRINIIAFLGLFLTLLSCDPNQVYEKNIEFEDLKWHKDSTVVLEAEITDTINAHDIYINVRNTSQYQNQNLFLFITTTSPNGTVLKDTFECYLADGRGKWTGGGFNWNGSGWGDLYDNQFLYKKSVRFPISGTYTFEYIQGMRVDELKYISDIGLRIEKVENR